MIVNTLRPIQNGRHFADDNFKRISLNENDRISIEISLKFVTKVPINNIPVLVQIMAWRRPGDKPLSEPMMVRLPTHICVTRPQWVNMGACNVHNFRPWLIFSRSFGLDSTTKNAKIFCILSCPLCNICSSGRILFLFCPFSWEGVSWFFNWSDTS